MINGKKLVMHLVALGVLAAGVAIPTTARAQNLGDLQRALTQRQKMKNEWRNIALASGAVAVLGLLNNDSTLTFVGAAGALYSANRYEQDRKSQNQLAHTRAAYFSRTSFYRDGVKYQRMTKWKKGKKYYYFQKVRAKH